MHSTHQVSAPCPALSAFKQFQACANTELSASSRWASPPSRNSTKNASP